MTLRVESTIGALTAVEAEQIQDQHPEPVDSMCSIDEDTLNKVSIPTHMPLFSMQQKRVVRGLEKHRY